MLTPFRFSTLIVTLSLVGLVFLSPVLQAATYFVAVDGNDNSDGSSESQAFSSVQKGVDTLAPGDTLIIKPGEYFESVYRDGLGSSELETTIKAKIPGTVILRGDIKAPKFTPTKGERFVYEAPFDRSVTAVNEEDTLKVFSPAASRQELRFQAGLFYFDSQEGKLYVSPSDYQDIEKHSYTISVLDANGLRLDKPNRVVIEGLAFRGYNTVQRLLWDPDFFTRHGVIIRDAKNSVIRDCTAVFNGSGIGMSSGESAGGNIIEKCRAYGNYGSQSQEGGNITGFHANNDIIRECVTFRSDAHGIRFYNKTYGPALIKDCLSWGNLTNDVALKGVGLDKFGRAENTIALGPFDADHLENCIMGTGNRYRRSDNPPSASNIIFAGVRKNWEGQFADPDNFDFRLQADSSYRRKGPDGTDAGPFPYSSNIFYVSSTGNDKNDGLSLASAWKSLPHALKSLRAGDTLYLTQGVYDAVESLSMRGTGEKPITIRGRGSDEVVLNNIVFTKASNVVLERLTFRNGVSLEEGSDFKFENCLFTGDKEGLKGKGVKNLQLRHCNFTNAGGTSLQLAETTGVFLSEISFAGASLPAVAIDEATQLNYSDYHAYGAADGCWSVGSKILSLDQLRPVHDRYSRVVATQNSKDDDVAFLVQGSALGAATGVSLFHEGKTLRVSPLEIHSVSAKTANIEWCVSVPATLKIAWGDTPECAKRLEIDANGFGSASLTDLEPGKTYYCKIIAASSPTTLAYSENVTKVHFSSEPISFQTAATDPAASTFYVSSTGSDANDGRTLSTPWKTIQYAADKVGVGDEVIVVDGEYSEKVRVRATGTAEAPITFRAQNINQATFDGLKWLNSAFVLNNKNHINIDGFSVKNFNNPATSSIWWMLNKSGAINAYLSDELKVTRIFYDGRQRGYSPPFLNVWKCKNLLVENSVLINLFNGMIISECPNIRILNNAFIRNKIRAANIFNDEAQPCFIENNIFTDNLKDKASQSLFEVSRLKAIRFKDNVFFVRKNSAERVIVVAYNPQGGPSSRVTMSMYDKDVAPSKSFFGNPDFVVSKRAVGPVGSEIDALVKEDLTLTLPDFYANNPEVMQRKIGLNPSAFGPESPKSQTTPDSEVK